jgi:ABC-2 type transport system ATP-binding protein
MILQGNLQQMHGRELTDRVDSLLEVVGLKDAANKRAGRYSGGMKKRLDLASTLVHKPTVLFLDEPTTGLDPQSRAAVWEYLEKLNKDEGITIFLTTQYLEEADRLCQRLCIVDSGKIVAEGTPSSLKKEIGADAISISMQDGQGRSPEILRGAAREIVSKLPAVVNVIDSGDGLTIYAKEGGYFIPDLVRAFDKTDIKLVSINLSTPTLDDVFLKHTGKRIRVEELVREAPAGRFGARRR